MAAGVDRLWGYPMTTVDEDARSKTIANERVKLTATFLNGVAIAMIAVGGLAPFTSITIGGAPLTVRAAVAILLVFVIACGLHLLARRFLRSLTS